MPRAERGAGTADVEEASRRTDNGIVQCRRRRPPRAGRGQSMTEYLVALAVVVAVVGLSTAGDPSILQFFLDSMRTGWARLLTALALPV